jgi:hypothetical protein
LSRELRGQETDVTRHFLPLVLPLVLISGPALADCPVKADLQTGIRLYDLDGNYELFQRHNEHIIKGAWVEGGVASAGYLLNGGLYLLDVHELESDTPVPLTRTTYAFPVHPADAPLPLPGGQWDVEVLVTEGGHFSTEGQHYAFGAPEWVNLGACDYRVIPVTVSYNNSNERDVLHYLPALGISYLSEIHEGDKLLDHFTYQSLENSK